MAAVFDFDYETRSQVDLTKVGVWNYAQHPSTEIVLMSYAFDEGEVKTWEPHISPMPDEVLAAFSDPFLTKRCFNCGFERIITRFVLGINIPICEWRDIQVMSRYFSLPGNLEDVCEILQLSDDVAKLKEGKELIRLFCEPFIEASESPLFGSSEPFFKDWRTNPAEWERFKTYNQHDVKSQIAIANKLLPFPVPADEWRLWELDQKINDRGIPVDMVLVDGSLDVVAKEQQRLEGLLKDLTGVDNVNSDQQILEWISKRGYPFTKIGKPFVNRALNGEGNLTDEARQALEIRAQLSKSSVDKFSVFKSMTGSDGRLRHQFSFMGAAKTGRYASRGINIQNLARPEKEVNDDLETAIALLQKGNYEGVQSSFKTPVLNTASSCLRPVFRAPDGQRFLIADLNAIEPRVVSWISGCQTILDIFNNNRDPYKSFGAEIFQKPYDKITKEERNLSKPGFLGCSYRLSAGKEIINADGDKTFTGLLGYARNMNVELSPELAAKSVAVFRKKYKEIKKFWYTLEDAFIRAVRDGEIVDLGKLVFEVHNNVLRIHLPSGRCLHYIEPWIQENVTFQTDTGEFTKTGLYHKGLNKENFQWDVIETHGGVLIENCLGADTKVVTNHGIKKLSSVTTSDLLWDGNSWVRHDGLITKGIKETGKWAGLVITKEHKILVGKSWKAAIAMDDATTDGALLSGLDSVQRLFSVLWQDTQEKRPLSAIADGISASQLVNYLGERLKNVLSADISKWVKTEKLINLWIQKWLVCGYIEEQELFLDVIIQNAVHTKTTEAEESLFTNRGEKTEKHGLSTQKHLIDGRTCKQIWTELTIMETMSRETSALLTELLTPIIQEKQRKYPMTETCTPTKISEELLLLSGLRTSCDITLRKERQLKKQWISTDAQEEVYDIRNAGKNNRFTVLSDLGPIVVHNCTQAIARDVLMEGIRRADSKMPVVLHVHDEIGSLVGNDASYSHEDLEKAMSEPIKWAEGLPLKAEGFESVIYRKN